MAVARPECGAQPSARALLRAASNGERLQRPLRDVPLPREVAQGAPRLDVHRALRLHPRLDQLAPWRLRKLCLYLQNEPFLDPKLIDRLRAARERPREAHVLRLMQIASGSDQSAIDTGAAE